MVNMIRIVLVCLLCFTQSVFAGVSQSSPSPRLFLLAGLDLSYARFGRDQTVVMLNDGTSNRYISQNKSHFATGFQLLVGAEWPFVHNTLLQAGVGLHRTARLSDTGDVYQFSDSEFDNFVYLYGVQSTRVMIEMRLLKKLHERLMPYVSLGLGGAINKAGAYQETAKFSGLIAMQPYTSNVKVNLAYQAGLGAEYQISPTMRLGLGYELASLGLAELGLSPSQTINSRFKSRNIYTNNVSIHITALA